MILEWGGALVNPAGALIKRGKLERKHVRRENAMRRPAVCCHSQGTAKARREAPADPLREPSRQHGPNDTLISGF